MKTSHLNSSSQPARVSVTWEDSFWFPRVLISSQRSRSRNRRGRCRVQIVTDNAICSARTFNEPIMKTNKQTSRRFSGFTLIELLVVIAIIAILAAMLLPAIATARTNVLKRKAKVEMSQIGTAIKSYESTYNGRFPVPPGIALGGTDYTFGSGFGTGVTPQIPSLATVVSIPTNGAIIAILMDVVTYGNGQPTPNKDHVLNLGRNAWLNVKLVSDSASAGVGLDGEYRDPWGNPYIISMDLSTDDRCRDALYSRTLVGHKAGQPVKVGQKGLSNPSGVADSFESPGQYLIWSKGPDGQAAIGVAADQGVNKDNILLWQE